MSERIFEEDKSDEKPKIGQMGAREKVIESDSGESFTYFVEPFTASDAIDLLPKLQKLIGRGVEPLLDSLNPDDPTGKGLGATLAMLAMEFQELGGSKFCRKLLSKTTRKRSGGQRVEPSDEHVFDIIYAANLGELGAAIWFVLQVNYGPLLQSRLGDKFEAAKQLLSKRWQNQLTTAQSTGSTGDS